MKIALIYFTMAGKSTCEKIEEGLEHRGHRCTSQAGNAPECGLGEWTREAFASQEALVFVSATGIAVRAIAPHLKGKTQDPAVVVVDEKGIHAISLLSGHMGGANKLTRAICEVIDAHPVITTATDINDKFSVDEWAKEQGLLITDMNVAKHISAALLRGEKVGFYTSLTVKGIIPLDLLNWGGCIDRNSTAWTRAYPPEWGIEVGVNRRTGGREGITWSIDPKKTLSLVPKCLVVGIGCRRGTPQETIQAAMKSVMSSVRLRTEALKKVASIDIKRDEEGLLAYAKQMDLPIEFFSAEELEEAEPPYRAGGRLRNEPVVGFSSSDFVKSVTGVDNVCERAAVLGCRGKARLLQKKTIRNGVAVAIAVSDEDYTVVF